MTLIGPNPSWNQHNVIHTNTTSHVSNVIRPTQHCQRHWKWRCTYSSMFPSKLSKHSQHEPTNPSSHSSQKSTMLTSAFHTTPAPAALVAYYLWGIIRFWWGEWVTGVITRGEFEITPAHPTHPVRLPQLHFGWFRPRFGWVVLLVKASVTKIASVILQYSSYFYILLLM